MTKPKIEDAPITIEAPPTVPFEDTENPSKNFEVTAPVDVARLQIEIAEAVGHDVGVIVLHTDLTEPISEKNPATVYVSAEKDFDGRKVRGAITSHDGSKVDPGQALVDDLRAGKDLSLKDLNAVVRRLVG